MTSMKQLHPSVQRSIWLMGGTAVLMVVGAWLALATGGGTSLQDALWEVGMVVIPVGVVAWLFRVRPTLLPKARPALPSATYAVLIPEGGVEAVTGAEAAAMANEYAQDIKALQAELHKLKNRPTPTYFYNHPNGRVERLSGDSLAAIATRTASTLHQTETVLKRMQDERDEATGRADAAEAQAATYRTQRDEAAQLYRDAQAKLNPATPKNTTWTDALNLIEFAHAQPLANVNLWRGAIRKAGYAIPEKELPAFRAAVAALPFRQPSSPTPDPHGGTTEFTVKPDNIEREGEQTARQAEPHGTASPATARRHRPRNGTRPATARSRKGPS